MEPILQIKELKIFHDKEGVLFETLRADDIIFDGKFGQNLISFVNPGVIKGLHLHRNQVEYTTCISGNIYYVAIRERKRGKFDIERIEVGERNPILIKTPSRIWHGYKSLNNRPAIIIYTMDKPYNSRNPDIRDRDPLYFGNVWV